MELFDLKNSWNALDKQLQQRGVVDEARISELIRKHQSSVSRNMLRITNWFKLSVGIGVIALLVFAVTLFIAPLWHADAAMQQRMNILAIFIGISIILGMCWDFKVYRFSKSTKVDEMPVTHVIERVNRFRMWIKYEVVALTVWALSFLGIYYWVQGFYEYPPLAQLLMIGGAIILIATIIYFTYKTFISKRIKEVRKNLKELEELEEENHPQQG